MEIFLANEQNLPVDETRLSRLARHALRLENVEEGTELSVLLVSSEHIRRLNARFAGDDYSTDVLSFPMLEDDDTLLGDVVISPDVAQRNAGRFGRSLGEELDTLLVHGTLHLLGYDHQKKEDRANMDRRMKQILESFAASDE